MAATDYEAWRMGRTELRDLLVKYEKAVEDDAFGLLRPSTAERRMLGDEVLTRRSQAVREARDANRRFVEALVDDLPDLCSGPDGAAAPARPRATFRQLKEGTPTLPASSYGSMASVFLHLFRDWSAECEHVVSTTYAPAIAELKEHAAPGCEVLVPGAGLARLAAALAGEGYRVEANEGSRLFLTVADYVLNRAPAAARLFPMAHVFSENFSHDQQYLEIRVPAPQPGEVLASGAPICMVPGDFAKTYCQGGPGHREFDAIVTCFFLDTVTDIVELVQVMDGVLRPGGVWVNIGPLNWRKEARMKLNWEEVMTLWKGQGYEFKTHRHVDCDYHMRRGQKMYTESYNCALTTAVKQGPPPSRV